MMMMHTRNNPAAKKSFLIANIALLTFFLIDIPARLYPKFHPDLMDAGRGFFLAIAVGMLITTTIKSKKS